MPTHPGRPGPPSQSQEEKKQGRQVREVPARAPPSSPPHRATGREGGEGRGGAHASTFPCPPVPTLAPLHPLPQRVSPSPCPFTGHWPSPGGAVPPSPCLQPSGIYWEPPGGHDGSCTPQGPHPHGQRTGCPPWSQSYSPQPPLSMPRIHGLLAAVESTGHSGASGRTLCRLAAV